MRRPIDVLFYVHHPQRELDAAIILCLLLKRDYGLTGVVASHLHDDWEVIARYSPRVVALPFYYLEEKGFFRLRKYFPSARFVNLAWEQLYSKVSATTKHIQGDYAKASMVFLAWGEEYQQFLLGDGVNRENIKVVGNPACGMLQEPYARRYWDRSSLAQKHGLDEGARWLFLPENWRAAYMKPAQYAIYDKGGQVGKGKLFHEWSVASLQTCCQWLKEAPGRTEIILRPRPFIDPTRFRAFVEPWLEGASKVHIIPDGTVREWVIASDATMSGLSSTLLESASAGRPTYVLAPLPVPEEFTTEWLALGRQITTQQEFNDQLCTSSGLDRDLRLESWVEKNLMVTADPLASMAKALAETARSSAEAAPRRPSELKLFLAAGAKNTRDSLKQRLRGKKEKRSRKDAFSQIEVEQLSKEWQRAIESSPVRTPGEAPYAETH